MKLTKIRTKRESQESKKRREKRIKNPSKKREKLQRKGKKKAKKKEKFTSLPGSITFVNGNLVLREVRRGCSEKRKTHPNYKNKLERRKI